MNKTKGCGYIPSGIKPPEDTKGFPCREANLDAYPGFLNPPQGYGEVGFYWWQGDPLTKERIRWQLDRLKDKSIMGLQVNYAHSDQGGFSFGYTYQSDPALFSEEWWELFGWFLGEAKKENISVSLSDYTLGTPGQGYFTDEVIKENPGLAGAMLDSIIENVDGETVFKKELPQNILSIKAFELRDGRIIPGSGIDLKGYICDDLLEWVSPKGDWRVIAVYFRVNPFSVDPMNPLTGEKIIEKFFARFEDRNPGEGGNGLNFFFSDELSFGVGGNLWNSAFRDEFIARKGYDLIPEISALFEDTGEHTPKIRLDYRDVMVSLEEEAYFKPVFDWHQKRGMIYGCDHGGRGKDVTEFGDYFRTQRWNQGPGNDQPFLYSDIIKNKVSASISHLYERPRTWLEGYHSSGWGSSSAQITDATLRNFISGHNLLTLHGLYYSTHGGWWEWAPPCNHFRMPYWEHMGEFMKCSERMCYLLSQGRHCCDVAVLYPVAPMEAGMDGEQSVSTAFSLCKHLYNNGVDFDFIDFQSLERAEIDDRQLKVAGESFRVLILPHMKAIRYSSIEKALSFYRSGGIVVCLGDLPAASDRAGYNDPVLYSNLEEIFGISATPSGMSMPVVKKNGAGGIGITASSDEQVYSCISKEITRDFIAYTDCDEPVNTWVMHRRVGYRDIFMLYGIPSKTRCFFRVKGAAELWDPWTGAVTPLAVSAETEDGCELLLPLEHGEAQIIIFDSTRRPVIEKEQTVAKNPPMVISLDGEWEFELKPTLDNTWGDFRLPAFNGCIGAEARRFRYKTEQSPEPGYENASFDDSSWDEVTYSHGSFFIKVGPVSDCINTKELEQKLSRQKKLTAGTDFDFNGTPLKLRTCDYSLRSGAENAPGHQGYHGLKEIVPDEFIILGRSELSYTGSECLPEDGGNLYYLWTSVYAEKDCTVQVYAGGIKPEVIYLNGECLPGDTDSLTLKAGDNILLLSYNGPGRASFVLVKGERKKEFTKDYPLAMSWYNKPDVMTYNITPGESPICWYRFTAPPGLKSMTMAVHGTPKCFIGGRQLPVKESGKLVDGAVLYEVSAPTAFTGCETVAVRVLPKAGFNAGAVFPEPIILDCDKGLIKLGDWSEIDGLRCYSGGAVYRKRVELDTVPENSRVLLKLNHLVSSVKVTVNGKTAGTRVAPPWVFDISELVNPGENLISAEVYNTLSNHYVTIPTRYRGDITSGLIGPVTIEIEH